MDLAFDFRFHDDPALLKGTMFVEITPGPYKKLHWQPGSRFIHYDTFCLFVGVFEQRFPPYAHYGPSEIPGDTWKGIVSDLASLQNDLTVARDGGQPTLPVGRSGAVGLSACFERDAVRHRAALGGLIRDFHAWLTQTLRSHDVVTVLGI
ncbi:MAG: hypothetical protein ABI972_06950 [Acidobacteriota bacterium]